jgi:hypothetical protein
LFFNVFVKSGVKTNTIVRQTVREFNTLHATAGTYVHVNPAGLPSWPDYRWRGIFR